MRYRLSAGHYTSEGRLLEAGTVVGNGPGDHPWTDEPTPDMVPIDDEAKKQMDATWKFSGRNEMPKYLGSKRQPA